MAGDGGAAVFGGVAPPWVVTAFANQLAAVAREMPHELPPFDGSDGDELLGEIILGGLAGFVAIECEGFF